MSSTPSGRELPSADDIRAIFDLTAPKDAAHLSGALDGTDAELSTRESDAHTGIMNTLNAMADTTGEETVPSLPEIDDIEPFADRKVA